MLVKCHCIKMRRTRSVYGTSSPTYCPTDRFALSLDIIIPKYSLWLMAEIFYLGKFVLDKKIS
jgi:hypothetical protein